METHFTPTHSASTFGTLPVEVQTMVVQQTGQNAVNEKTAAENDSLGRVDAARARTRELYRLALVSPNFRAIVNDALKDMPASEARAATRTALESFAEKSDDEFRSLVTVLLQKYRHVEVPFSALTDTQRDIVFEELAKSDDNVRAIKSVYIDADSSNPDIAALLSNVKTITAGKRDEFSVSLNLTGNAIGDEQAQLVARALQDPEHKILGCELRDNVIGDKGAEEFAAALKDANCMFTEIDLAGNAIGTDGVKALSEAFKHPNCKVEICHLDGNRIDNSGALHLASAFESPQCPVLVCNLSGNRIENVGAWHLANAFRNRDCKLRLCYLGGNQLDATGDAHLTAAENDENCKTQIWW